ncbi:MAG: outer membrane beta-barrel protein [Bacteroidota bacterium]
MRFFLFTFLLLPITLFSQNRKDSIHFSGYTEIYFAQDQHNWNDHERPDFLYSHTSTNHFTLNTAVLDFKYSSDRIKTQLSLVEGTYANKVTSAEPIGFGAMYLGNVAYQLIPKNSLWLQAGVFPSHIGIETAIGFSNLSLSRSLAAENSPYYESGLNLQYNSKNNKWFYSLLLLNGWQTMTLRAQQRRPDIGSQIQFKPNSNITLNHSTYYGEVAVVDSSQTRFFQNFYATFLLKEKWNIQLQADYGIQETGKERFNKNWNTGFFGIGYKANEKIQLAGRAEWINDENNLVLTSVTNKMWGYSFNINYLLNEKLLLRAEWRNITTNKYAFTFQNFSDKRINGLNLSLAAQF